MPKPETNFRNSIRQNLRSNFDVMAIESGDTAAGIPDSHIRLIGTNKTCWLELKVCEKFPKKVDLRDTQPPWHRKYCRDNGLSFIVLKVLEERNIYVWDGIFARELLFVKKPIIEIQHTCFNTHNGGWRDFGHFLKNRMITHLY